jgi:hypothetical protein
MASSPPATPNTKPRLLIELTKGAKSVPVVDESEINQKATDRPLSVRFTGGLRDKSPKLSRRAIASLGNRVGERIPGRAGG